MAGWREDAGDGLVCKVLREPCTDLLTHTHTQLIQMATNQNGCAGQRASAHSKQEQSAWQQLVSEQNHSSYWLHLPSCLLWSVWHNPLNC